MNLNKDELIRKRNAIQEIINRAYRNGGGTYAGAAKVYDGDFHELVRERNKLDSQIKLANSTQSSLSLTPTQSTETTPTEITLVPNLPSGVQRRIDELSEEDKALFNKFAVNYLEDKDDIVNKMTRAVVSHYPQVFPDLYHVYSTLYTNNPTAPNIENASQWPVSEQESPISAPRAVANPSTRAVANPSTGIPITKEDVKYVITELAFKPFGGKAVVGVGWNLDEIADTILTASNQYKVDPRLFLAQGIIESHFGANPDAGRSRRTKNIYNVGNVAGGRDNYYSSYTDGIRDYARLMNQEYNWGGEGSWVTPEMMIEKNFTRSSGQGRYATAPNYTNVIQQIVKRVDKTLAERYQGRRMVLVPNPAQSEDPISAPANTLSSPASLVKAAVANKASQYTKPKGILGTIDGRFSGPPNTFSGPPNTRIPLFTPWDTHWVTPWAR